MGTLVLNGATSGSTTLQPTDATTQTITLPANSGTVITTASSGKVIPTAALPAGTVLQVVQSVYTNAVFSSTATYADTGLTASITPTSATSKILVLINHGDPYKSNGNANNAINIKLVRNSSDIYAIGLANGYMSGSALQNNLGPITANYLDSPATTSSTTYKTQFANYGGSNANVGLGVSGASATITLMEIAA